MLVAIGIVKSVKEDANGIVISETITRQVQVTALDRPTLIDRMCDEAIRVDTETSTALLLCEISEIPCEYPILTWGCVFEVEVEVSLDECVQDVHSTEKWEHHRKFGGVESVRQVVETMKNEIADRREVVGLLESHVDETLAKIKAAK